MAHVYRMSSTDRLSQLRKNVDLNQYVRRADLEKVVEAIEDAISADGTIEADIISEETSGTGVTIDSLLIKDGKVDLNGVAGALIIDADADTHIGASTDDQIDVTISGAIDFTLTANTLTAVSGSTIATNTIAETTAASGVTIDGVLVKDGGATLTGSLDLSGSTVGIKLSTNVIEITKEVTLTATEIVGTDAGDLGHTDGAILVAAPSSSYALEFVSATLIYDFDTAAYTGGAGDDLVVRIGTTAVSPAVATADLITAAGDQVVHLRALSAADYDLPVGSSINLKCTEVTQPGTAAGVIRVIVTYRQITTNL